MKKNSDNSKEDEEIVFEEDNENVSSFTTSDKKLKEKLKECEKERKEYLDGWQRSRAEFANLKKKSEEERLKQRVFGREEVLEEMFRALDSFEMAFRGEAWEKVDSNWRTGVEYIYSQMLSSLESFGVTQIDPIGEKFDPNTHTSVESVATDDEKKDEIISDVIQKGYRSNDRIIRSPKVKVFNYKAPEK
jgi:molecular chaperone GrpE